MSRPAGRSWAVFLDRDGVLTSEVGHVTSAEGLILIPGVTEALRRLRAAGAVLVVVTNQSSVARELIDEKGLAIIHEQLRRLLAEGGAELDGLYYCPHHPEEGEPRYRMDCDCRKPNTGMLVSAAERFGIDMQQSYFIGDSTRDLLAANRAGCCAVLVRTGNAGEDGQCPEAKADLVADDLGAAVEKVLAARAGTGRRADGMNEGERT